MSSRRQRFLIYLSSAFLCASLAAEQTAPNGEQRRIREVRINVAPVYTEEHAQESGWARGVNRFHTPTRESVIRNQILFKEGDVLDPQLLESSERQLRAFKFINKAAVIVVPVDDKTVDVEVNVKDAWSLEPGINISAGGGLATVSGHLIDFNLLGSGKKLYGEAIYENDVGTTWKFGYSDYQMFNSRWVGNAVYSNGPLVESFFAQARLPLYSPDSKWSYGGSAYKADRIIRLFEDGEESSRFAKDQLQINGILKRSFGERFKKVGLSLKLQYLKADFSPLGAETTTPLPPDQENLTPTIGVNKESIGFDKRTFIDKMGYVEDNWIGLKYGARLGYGIPIGDSIELWDARVFVFKKIALPHEQLASLSAAVISEVVRNTFVTFNGKYYKRFSRHTVATHFKANIGYELDPSRQFQLGGDSGLRGYDARAFTGEKLLLLNLEDRQFWGEISAPVQLAIGTVVFVDAGNVWNRDEDIDLEDLNWSAGVGVRIGMSKAPKQPILRVDVGWGFAVDSYAVTIGAEQQF